MPFTTSSIKVQGSDGLHWTILEEFTYWTDDAGTLTPITVPAGATTDGASVPRALWTALPPVGGPWWMPSVLHDYLYRSRPWRELYHNSEDERARYDAVFLEAMENAQVPQETREIIFHAVRAFGSRSLAT